MRLKHTFSILVLALAVVFTTACGASRESALDKSTDELVKATSGGNMAAAVAEGDAMWAGRLERAKLEGAIAKWESAASMASEGFTEQQRIAALYDLHVKLARAYYFLGDSHVRLSGGDEDALEAEMITVFNKGLTAAEKALVIYSPSFAKAIRFDKDFQDEAMKLDKGAAGALYWYATNLGKWALLEGIATILSRKDDIKVVMDKLEKESPDYFHAGPFRYFGAYYTKVPLGGGDPDNSRAYFDKAVAAAPNYLATRVLFAEMHGATQTGDEAIFDTQLKYVIEFDLSKAPDLAPENEFEQRKAKLLIQNKDEFSFD